jgi:hypothetical protein
MPNVLRIPVLTRGRIWLAFGIAVAVDALQIVLGPFGWAGFDEVSDVVTMVALSAVLGFHTLFLPTFVVKLIPVVDFAPTWTASVAIVVALRRRKARGQPPPAPPPLPPAGRGEVIDV